ncbi:MAG TPA: hypothetical protein VML55_23300, partial [Planctomycetaceae bacterium]|nr:hypothetical protein [Planctomycetaceae bacterium]
DRPMSNRQRAVKYDLEVREGGRIELDVPFPAGTPVAVLVVKQSREDFTGLLDAARSSLDFWDNPWDDEDWNNA